MKKLTSILLLIILMTGFILTSCSKDDEDFLFSGTSWKVTEDNDSTMVGVILTFMDNGDVRLSKPLDGWNNPKWAMTVDRIVNGCERCKLTITMEGGNYITGTFYITGEFIQEGATTHNAKNVAEYNYTWFEKDEDSHTLERSYTINLRKQ